MQDRVVIIGAGIAGVRAAEMLSPSFDVTLINNEPYLPYYRMRIEEVVSGSSPESLFMHPAKWYEDKGIRMVSGAVLRIDDEARAVYLSDGASLPFDSLVIATGSKANVFPLEGSRKEYFSLRTIEDAVRIREALASSSSATIIGGGLLGLELASSIASHSGVSVSVVETAPYILPRQLDGESAALLESLLKDKGVSVITDAKAKGADESSLFLEDGRSTAGVHTDLSITDGTRIKTGRGIIVDSFLRTSVPGIYAIGDAAELDGRLFGLAMHAREMGSAVASLIMGGSAPYIPSSPSSMLKVGGLDVASFGEMKGDPIVREGERSRRTLFVEDGILKGAVFVGEKAPASVKAMIGKPYGGEDGI